MDAIADLVRQHWDLDRVEVSPLGGGMNSETWRVEHQGARYVAKRVSAGEVGELTRGCEIASRLAAQGLVTGRPLPTMNGELVAAGEALVLLEYAPGRELDGESDGEQRWIADTLARVHTSGGPAPGSGTATFFGWLTPAAPGVAVHPWLPAAIEIVRAETDAMTVTWSVLHTDPAPEAFRHEDRTGVTGLIDWTGAQQGPVLYDVASVVMYLGGPGSATAFLDAYRDIGPLASAELQRLDAFRRFRWTVQAAYFAGRLATRDLTGIADQTDNQHGLDRARRGLAELDVDIGQL